MTSILLHVTREALHRIRSGATAVVTDPAAFRMEGPGAVDCLQGLLTSDVVRPGVDSVVYGAVLTPKGMILVDVWCLRDADGFTLLAEPSGRQAALDLFRRQVPPRLARVEDRTGEVKALWLIGADSRRIAAAAGLPLPEPGHLLVAAGCRVAAPGATAPMALVIVGPDAAVRAVEAGLSHAGAVTGSAETLDLARIVAGWPVLGREIGERTLPQEVRYDELDGVSYTKGCYVGQETVARVHFRGHPNRLLRGLTWRGEAPHRWTARSGDRDVGQATSALQMDGAGLALALIRREVAPGTTVTLGESAATVVELPFVVS